MRKRVDLRLIPAVVATWTASLVGGFIPGPASGGVCAVLALAAVFLLAGAGRPEPGRAAARTLSATLAIACISGAVAAGHCALTAGMREHGPLAGAVGEGEGVLIHIMVKGTPASVASGNSGHSRWIIAASLIQLTSHEQVVRGAAELVVVGGDEWRDVQPGQGIRTTGTLKEARPGQSEAAVLSASSGPVIIESGFDVNHTAAQLRTSFRGAASWLPPDAAGLLPGMVAGDTSALPEELEADMKTVGMTHLTAVSGANCSLIMGAFLILARSLRLSRPLAAAAAGAGLTAFVVLVGPEPSVLRAAVMGFVGLMAMTGGLRGRSLTFLCLATVVLLLLDPTLAGTYGFLLSVLATLGIVLFAGRIATWLPSRMPPWLAAGLSVPLSAQVLCGPVLVALQPQLSPYALIANVLAGPLVAPVTIMGTLAVPLSVIHPAGAAVPVALAGTSAGMVAGVARFFAGLPGAALPWAEGAPGIVAMALLSVLTMGLTWALLHPAGVIRMVFALHDRLVKVLEKLEATETRNLSDRGLRGRWARRPPRHGRLETCKKSSGRNHPWLLPKTPGPRAPLRTPSVGGRQRRPP